MKEYTMTYAVFSVLTMSVGFILGFLIGMLF